MTDPRQRASVAEGADSEPAPGTKIGRHVLLERVGDGSVFSAYDPELDRRIALKLLASSGAGDEARLRLLREAQAMARLSHPNVVPVYDVGTAGGRVFVAMEFVEGLTLRAWLDHEPRAWTDVVDIIRRAALGLQAAHDAGLVHGDFDLDDVMVGDDGRVRVLDFKLARDETDAAPADQWSFCATSYEALYGSRPLEGSTVAEPPRSSPVPRPIFTAIARGLEVDPSARHPSMAALLDALELGGTAPSRRRAVVVTSLAAGAALAAALWWRDSEADRANAACDARAAAAAQVWSARARQAGADAFAASAVGDGAEAWARSSDRIETYVESWAREAGRACRASSPDTAALDELRTRCLDDGLRRLRSVVDAFATANDEVVRSAVQTAFDLPDLETCADLPRLLATVRLPDDPADRAELARLENELEVAAASKISADYARGRELAQVVVDRARALAHDPFTAEALFTLASFDRRLGDYEAARNDCVEAFERAAAAHDDVTAAKAAIEIVHIVGYELESADAAQAWTPIATTMVAVAGQNQQAPEASLHNALGNVAYAQGDHERARAEFSAALEIWEALPDHPMELGNVLNNLGSVCDTLGKVDEAREYYSRALRIREETFGPNHPEVAVSLGDLGVVAMRRGDLVTARALQERALAIKRATLPPGHPSIAAGAGNLGTLLTTMGELEDARVILEEAVEIATASGGPEHASAAAMSNLAVVYVYQGRNEDAEALLRRVLEVQEKTQGPNHPAVSQTLLHLGELLRETGRLEQAMPLLERALAIRTETFGPDTASVGDCWSALSRLHADFGQGPEAIDAARKAVMLAEHGERDEFYVARERAGLGTRLWRFDDDQDAARRMVEEAAAIMAKSPEFDRERQAELQAWLQAHPVPE